MTHEDGGDVAYGYVKTNPQNNAKYLDNTYLVLPELADLLRKLDEDLEKLVPGYNIAQIKIKFDDLRYYVDIPECVTTENRDKVYELIGRAEAAAHPLLNPEQE